MAPEAKLAPALLYIANTTAPSTVDVYSYPKGRPVGTLTGFGLPEGECADKAGDVWITDSNYLEIVEYAHGGTSPIAVLRELGYKPWDCSVDPTTGNLAVTNVASPGKAGSVAIYADARGQPTVYSDPTLGDLLYCGYDADGNLFVDGLDAGNNTELAELPKNLATFTNMPVSTVKTPGGVLWDGQHVAVLDSSANVIYQFAIEAGQANEVGSTPLDYSSGATQFWLYDRNVIAGDANAEYDWPYPAGGNPIKVIVGPTFISGSAISKVPRK